MKRMQRVIYMKKPFLVLMSFAFAGASSGHDAEAYYNRAMETAGAGQLEDAIKLLDTSIQLNAGEPIAWYNRGIMKGMLDRYDEALPDFEQTVKLQPDYKKGYLNRGTAKKHLTDFEGALADYTYALKLDPKYPDAYYNRGIVYDMLDKKDLACADFKRAGDLGSKHAQDRIDGCNDTTAENKDWRPIYRLTKYADNDTYGYTQGNPVKTGGGPPNQERYLDLLRDSRGGKVKYVRLGSCCEYKSTHAFMGDMALLDRYGVTFTDETGKEKTVAVYISMYDYDEPMVLHGFTTVGRKK